MKFIVTSRKGAAVAVAFMLSAPTVALIGVNPALASTDSFSSTLKLLTRSSNRPKR